ncbi:hypothetical protein RS84_00046 [Microbacterium hydrocarbonoxydans]|uniref:Uncharacterized protein n=1 Tax=Microbacterium hydrocarbonoxydans TaxID=273678 RepID=A0A0M2HS38_9MICO|nr:hypothetical protein [Microbacterium hydrocarbonoxydans]KJL49572.1 hypothetical protein RS84_00046 [Microbacterium hydrocarbonoxydans]
MTKRYTPGEPVGAMRPGCVLDYSCIVVSVADDCRSLQVRFSDGEIERVSTHPDFTWSMRRAYRYAAKYTAEADARGGDIESTAEAFDEFTAGCARRPDYFDRLHALWVLRRDPEGARLGCPVAFAQDMTAEGR